MQRLKFKRKPQIPLSLQKSIGNKNQLLKNYLSEIYLAITGFNGSQDCFDLFVHISINSSKISRFSLSPHGFSTERN